jgi:acetylornithine deacetylase
LVARQQRRLNVTSTSNQRRTVLERIDRMKDDLVQLTSRLVRIRSVNPRYPGVDFKTELGGEAEVNRYLRSIHHEMGLRGDMWAEEDGRENLVSVWKGTGGGQSLIHNGHVDTVPTGPSDQWKWGDPFSGKVADGRVYGRGGCDMKGPIAAQLIAIRALQESGVRLQGDVLLATTVGEENMDSARIGAGALGRHGYSAAAAIVSEPSAPPCPLALAPVSSGLWWVSIHVSGKTSHASVRGETIRAGGVGSAVAVDAIDKAVFLFTAIRKLEDQWGVTKKHPLFKPGHFTMLPGVITGGPHGVQVPFFISDFCTIEYCIWYHPEEDPQQVKCEFDSYVRHSCQLDDWLREHPPTITWKVNWPAYNVDPNHPICRTVARAHEEAAQDSRFAGPPRLAGFYAVCDAAFLNPQGIPSIVYGPGSLLVAHAIDEFIEIDELVLAAKTYALATMDWCKVSD